MTRAIVVVGTDTNIGKTVVSAGLTQALGADYWKPVQSGLEDETDSQFVARLSGATALPEVYRLKLPASPHLSAEAEGVEIDPARLQIPETDRPLVIEGAGGLLVPLTRRHLYLDVIAQWQVPVVLCARTSLGTINHSLLSLQALRAAGCHVLGLVFVGAPEPEVETTICQFGDIRRLGRLPILDPLTSEALSAACAGLDLDPLREVLG